jgi:hypothetical protein
LTVSTQRRIVRDANGSFDFLGGATVIIGPKGEVRYVIAKNILNKQRCEQQREFMRGAGQRYWEKHDENMAPVRNVFELLHEPEPARIP